MGLTDKQEQFCLEYATHFNATRAAINAGYSEDSARQQGSRLLTNDDIRDRVIELSNATADELGITRRRILTRLWENAVQQHPGGSNKALELLMKHRGDLIEKVHHEGGIDINVNGVDLDNLK